MPFFANFYFPAEHQRLHQFLMQEKYLGGRIKNRLKFPNKRDWQIIEVTDIAFSEIKRETRVPNYNFEIGDNKLPQDNKLLLIKDLLPSENPIMEPNINWLKWVKSIAQKFETTLETELTHERGDALYHEYAWIFDYREKADPIEKLRLDWDEYRSGTSYSLYRDGTIK